MLSSITVLIFAWNEIKVIPLVAWMITQSTVFQFWTPDCLRGFGCGTPNGSLWTIGVMVQCYIVLWVLYRLLHKKKTSAWFMILSITVLVSIFSPVLDNYLPQIIYKLYGQTFVEHIWLFILGAFICEYKENLIVTMGKYWWIFFSLAFLISISGFDVGYYGTMRSFFIGPAILGFAYKYPKLDLPHDISYGFYIYHMVVINVLIEFGMTGKFVDVIFSFGLTVALAIISYVTFGKIGKNKKPTECTEKMIY